MPRRSQEDRSAATRTVLVATARRLFAERGYAHVPTDEIVAAAGVTRGALYHHYTDKRDLFRAVYEQVEAEIAAEVAAAVDAAAADVAGDPWPAMAGGVRCFLDLCERPDVLRIGLTDAPAVLGWQAWREIAAAHGLGLITRLLADAARTGALVPVAPPVLAQLVLGALTEAALAIAHSPDPATTRAEAEHALIALLSGTATGR